jgi:hypothetical protein
MTHQKHRDVVFVDLVATDEALPLRPKVGGESRRFSPSRRPHAVLAIRQRLLAVGRDLPRVFLFLAKNAGAFGFLT